MPLSKPLAHPAVRALCAALALSPLSALAADLNLSVADGPAADAQLYVALYADAASYTGRQPLASQITPLRNGQARLAFLGLAPGRYALRLFADENGNATLDTNLLGMPTERYGFSNDARGTLGAPDFEAAALQIDADLQTTVHLR